MTNVCPLVLSKRTGAGADTHIMVAPVLASGPKAALGTLGVKGTTMAAGSRQDHSSWGWWRELGLRDLGVSRGAAWGARWGESTGGGQLLDLEPNAGPQAAVWAWLSPCTSVAGSPWQESGAQLEERLKGMLECIPDSGWELGVVRGGTGSGLSGWHLPAFIPVGRKPVKFARGCGSCACPWFLQWGRRLGASAEQLTGNQVHPHCMVDTGRPCSSSLSLAVSVSLSFAGLWVGCLESQGSCLLTCSPLPGRGTPSSSVLCAEQCRLGDGTTQAQWSCSSFLFFAIIPRVFCSTVLLKFLSGLLSSLGAVFVPR